MHTHTQSNHGPQALSRQQRRQGAFLYAGTMMEPEHTPWTLCEAGKPLCPRCEKPIRRVTPITGSTVLTCERSRSGTRCGQHLHVTAVSEGLCLVLPLSANKAQAIRDAPERGVTPSAKRIYKELGHLPKPKAS